jgi:hypothetical protein
MIINNFITLEHISNTAPELEVPLHRVVGAWVKELPAVLWSIHTTPNRSTGYTNFLLVYGAEAILPSDISHDSLAVAAYEEEKADQKLRDAVDLLDEERELALERSAIYQQKLRSYHSRRVNVTPQSK